MAPSWLLPTGSASSQWLAGWLYHRRWWSWAWVVAAVVAMSSVAAIVGSSSDGFIVVGVLRVGYLAIFFPLTM
jgi:hypothetical protein